MIRPVKRGAKYAAVRLGTRALARVKTSNGIVRMTGKCTRIVVIVGRHSLDTLISKV